MVHDEVQVWVYNKLCKVPRDVLNLSGYGIFVAFGHPAQVPKQGVRAFSVDVALLHKGEHGSHAVACKVDYLLFVRDFLVEELRAGEGHDLHPILLVLFIHVHQFNVGLVREGSLRRHVHDDRQLEAFSQLSEAGRLALDRGEGVAQDLLAGGDVSMR